jgi:DNA-binding NarL/FixJ family response regulator
MEPAGRRALVVDDHPSFRRSARRMLEAAGWDVVGEAGGAADARRAAADLRPDLVLLDVQLPGEPRAVGGAQPFGHDQLGHLAPHGLLGSAR